MTIDFKDKTIMITGGTGSFGRVCAKTLIELGPPKRLIIFSRDELKQHEMQQELNDPCLRYFIGDVRDKERVTRAMAGVDYVIHTAALKQVPACEYNPFEAIKTNILGGVNVVDAAIDQGVEKVIALSTDKAVNPVNIYGATKLCAEKVFVQANSYSGQGGTILSCARYGNVVASRGSVIPLFRQQRDSGTVTVTDERMTRFWITLEQGVAFVLRCLENMRGGEIFVPKIPSMSLMDLVTAIAPDAKVKMTGLRPGEKIHEILVSEEEAPHTLEFPDMYVIQPTHNWWDAETWKEGDAMAEGFNYGSQNNTEWLSVDQLLEMVKDI